MGENGKKSNDWKIIAGGIALIVVLFVGIKLVFWGLERAIPRPVPDVSVGSSVSVQEPDPAAEDAPRFCVYCGRELPESFRWGQYCPYCGKQAEN